ncbi:MAG: beta-lactamase family protein [Flammeovirgaceae bacterium]|nr:beta-lactamase family protein [Flammeovirgaceae bacterium]
MGLKISKKILSGGLLYLILFKITPLKAQQASIPGAEVTPLQTEIILENISSFPQKTELSIAILKGDTVNFVGLKLENDSLIFCQNQDFLFEIGAITKVFTSSLFASLVIGGVVKLEDPMVKFLDFTPKQSKKGRKEITLLSLANHTSGLPNHPNFLVKLSHYKIEDPYAVFGKPQMEQYLKKRMKLKSPPGEKYEYSNLGVGILGYLLENKTGKSYQQMIEDEVFSTYNMPNSELGEKYYSGKLVKGRDKKGVIVPPANFNAMLSSGGILSTTQDLSNFILANFSNDYVMDFQRTKTFSISQNMDMALGWHIMKTEGEQKWFWHNGATAGYKAAMVMDVKNQKSIIVLSNISGFNPIMENIDLLTLELMDTLY